MNTFYIKTFGCQMNVYDSNRMADLLREKAHLTPVDDPKIADVIILNTCSIREKPHEKIFSELGRFNRYKKKRPHVVIAVGGCVPVILGQAILKRAPYVDLIFGPQAYHRLPMHLMHLRNKEKEHIIDLEFSTIEKFDTLPTPHIKGPIASLSIMEGCNHYCSYCVVPFTRGREVHRTIENIQEEVEALLAKGVKDITLLGQNVNEYLGTDKNNAPVSFSQLIRRIATYPELLRIRFTSSHPNAFTEALLHTYRDVPKLMSHLHLPVQSGSDVVLQKMRRRYQIADYIEKIEILKTIRPDILISSDFIVGFPGETDRDFQATLDLVDRIHFDHSFSFAYSPRPGTVAARFEDDVPMSVKKERLEQLQTKLNAQVTHTGQQMIGKTMRVLIENSSEQGLIGRCENNRIVYFKNTDKILGDLVDVRITDTRAHVLYGEMVEKKPCFKVFE